MGAWKQQRKTVQEIFDSEMGKKNAKPATIQRLTKMMVEMDKVIKQGNSRAEQKFALTRWESDLNLVKSIRTDELAKRHPNPVILAQTKQMMDICKTEIQSRRLKLNKE